VEGSASQTACMPNIGNKRKRTIVRYTAAERNRIHNVLTATRSSGGVISIAADQLASELGRSKAGVINLHNAHRYRNSKHQPGEPSAQEPCSCAPASETVGGDIASVVPSAIPADSALQHNSDAVVTEIAADGAEGHRKFCRLRPNARKPGLTQKLSSNLSYCAT
jgi:hypothetical protein